MVSSKLDRNKSKILYVILLLLILVKIISFNFKKTENLFLKQIYLLKTSDYSVIKSYDDFKETEDVSSLYFGSLDCPYCVDNRDKIDSILTNEQKTYYFKVDFYEDMNQQELERFKEEFQFDTIPHIII